MLGQTCAHSITVLGMFHFFINSSILSEAICFGSGQDVKWLQTITTMPILVKGVLTAEDGKNSVYSALLFF